MMYFSMTIGTQENTFVQLGLNSGPASRIPFGRNAKVFFSGIQVMKFQCG